MPPSQRRPHTKSRLGCQQCKKQRTKCDEKRPSCTRCQRTGISCSLADTNSSLFIINTSAPRSRRENVGHAPTSLHTQSSARSPRSEHSTRSPYATRSTFDDTLPDVEQTDNKPRLPSPSQYVQFTDAERMRLRLMNHYSQFTATSIATLTHHSIEASLIWEIEIPRLAFENDYLLHGMLSVSALHLAILQPSSEHNYATLAVQHHNQGISLFTPHLMNITAENIEALFAFSCFTGIYSFGIHHQGGLQLSPLVMIYEVFTMIAGTGIIVKSGLDWLQSGIWSIWFRPRCEEYIKPLSREVDEVMTRLRRRIDTTITTSSQSEMYLKAIGALEENFRQFDVLPRNQMSIVMLPVLCPPGFQQMVCIGEPLALAILGNWAVILHWLREHIWLSNWGAQTVKTIHDTLPPEWRDCITWAVGEVENTGTVLQLPTPSESEPDPVNLAMGYESGRKICSGLLF